MYTHTHTKPLTTSLAFLALGLCGARLRAQDAFGDWHVQNGQYPVDFLYVSPAGADTNPGTVSQPVRTISEAIRRANAVASASVANPIAVSINVKPGTYDPAAGETFPIQMVNRGAMIEAWDADVVVPTDPPSAPTSTLPVVRNFFASRGALFDVSLQGHSALPDSGLRGLRIELGSVQIGVNIVTRGTSPETVSKVLVERCEILMQPTSSGSSGIEIVTQDQGRAAHRILDNLIAGTIDATIQPPILYPSPLSSAILELLYPPSTPASRSSILVRGNTSYLLQAFYQGFGMSTLTSALSPRIESNAVQLCTSNIRVEHGEPWIVNNTIAYARSHAATTLAGVWLQSTGVARIYNNIVWNPTYGAFNTLDFISNGAAVVAPNPLLDIQSGNSTDYLAAGNTNVAPQFVGFAGAGSPGLVLTDLHLAALSPLIGAGSVALVDPVDSINNGGMQVRRDVAFDMEGDPRITARATGGGSMSQVDVGADQRHATRITPAFAADPLQRLDVLGNLQPYAESAASKSFRTEVNLTGTPGAAYALYLGFGFFATAGSPPAENESVFQHVLLPGFGAYHVGLGAAESLLVATGSIGAAGTTVTVDLGSWGPILCNEVELFLQAVTLASSGLGQTSSRQPIELNWK